MNRQRLLRTCLTIPRPDLTSPVFTIALVNREPEDGGEPAKTKAKKLLDKCDSAHTPVFCMA